MADEKPKKIKYSSDPDHIRTANMLRTLREEAELDSQVLADLIGISRKTLSAIENCHLSAISSLKKDVEIKWYKECQPRISRKTKESFRDLLLNRFKF